MAEVLSASVRFPTVVFTVVAVVMIALWVLSLFGVFDAADATSDGFLDGVFDPLGFGDAPFTVVLSVLGLIGWLASVLAQIFLLDQVSGAALVVASLGVLVVALALGGGAAWLAAPALSRALEIAEAPSGAELVGRTAEIRSLTVSASSGYADVTWPDGPVSRVEVRVAAHGDVADGELTSGDQVLLVDWDVSDNTYVVSRLPADLA